MAMATRARETAVALVGTKGDGHIEWNRPIGFPWMRLYETIAPLELL
jgi:hypothetical protein